MDRANVGVQEPSSYEAEGKGKAWAIERSGGKGQETRSSKPNRGGGDSGRAIWIEGYREARRGGSDGLYCHGRYEGDAKAEAQDIIDSHRR